MPLTKEAVQRAIQNLENIISGVEDDCLTPDDRCLEDMEPLEEMKALRDGELCLNCQATAWGRGMQRTLEMIEQDLLIESKSSASPSDANH